MDRRNDFFTKAGAVENICMFSVLCYMFYLLAEAFPRTAGFIEGFRKHARFRLGKVQ